MKENKKYLLVIAVILSLILICLPVYGYLYIDSTFIGSDTVPDQPHCIYGVDTLIMYPTPEYAADGFGMAFGWFGDVGCSDHVSGLINKTAYGNWENSGFYANDYFFNYSCICPHENHTYVNLMADEGANLHIYGSWKWEDPGYADTLIPVCSYTASPLFGAAPLSVSFVDTSTNTPTSWNWIIKNNGSGFTEQLTSSINSFTGVLNNQAFYDVNHTATNLYGSCNDFSPNLLQTTTPTSTTLDVAVYDAITHNAISGATVTLKNETSGLSTSQVATTGQTTFAAISGQPLSIGETVTVSATAYGYTANSVVTTIPYSGYGVVINLMPTSAVNATGTFWLTVSVTKNEDGTPLSGAIVQVLSGGNNYQTSTYSDGVVTLKNITSSTSFAVTAFAQAYTDQTKVLPKTADFMNVSFSLVRKGAIPVTTPKTPVPTGTPVPIITDPATGKPYVDSKGNPVSSGEASAFAAFGKLSAVLGTFFDIGIGIIMIWLLWVLVYEITGGKVIEKLIRRGRK